MKTKGIRIYYRTYKLLRQMVKGKRGETMADYLDRAVKQFEIYFSEEVFNG